MSGHNPERLRQLGTEMKRIRARERAIKPELYDLIRAAAAADVAQVEIVEATGYTRDQVRQICLPPGQKRSRSKAARRDPNPPRYPTGTAAA